MPGAASTSRISWSSARRATASPRRSRSTAEVYRAAGALHGGAPAGWPASPTRAAGGRPSTRNEEALDMLVAAIERAGYPARRGGRDRARRRGLRVRPRAAATGLASTARELDTRRHDRACSSAGSAAIRSCRSRIRWPRTMPQGFARLHRQRSATGPGRRRRSPRDRCGAGREAARRAALHRRADQAEPGAARSPRPGPPRGGARSRAGGDRLGALGRDRGRRPSRISRSAGTPASSRSARSPARERMAKWNEVLRIEEALGGRARFAAEPRSALLPER